MSSLPLSALPALQPPHLAYDPGGRDRPARPRDPVPRAPRPLRSAREDHAVDAPPLALGVGDRRDRVLDALPPLRARLSRRVFARRRIALSCAYGSWGGRRPSIGRLRQVDGSRGRGDRLRMPFMLPILPAPGRRAPPSPWRAPPTIGGGPRAPDRHARPRPCAQRRRARRRPRRAARAALRRSRPGGGLCHADLLCGNFHAIGLRFHVF